MKMLFKYNHNRALDPYAQSFAHYDIRPSYRLFSCLYLGGGRCRYFNTNNRETFLIHDVWLVPRCASSFLSPWAHTNKRSRLTSPFYSGVYGLPEAFFVKKPKKRVNILICIFLQIGVINFGLLSQ